MNSPRTVGDRYADEVAALAAQRGIHYRRDALIGLMAGVFPIVMSATVINVAVADLQAYFGAGPLAIQVLASAFLASMTAAMLLSGGLIGQVGVLRGLRISLALFIASSLLAALLPRDALVLLVALRGVQGFIGGVVQSLAMMVVISIFPAQQRGRAVAFYGLGIVLSPTVGPFVGGFLTSAFGWQSVFVFALPFAAWSWWVVPHLLPQSAPTDLPRGIRLVPAICMAVFVTGLSGAFLVGAHDLRATAAFTALGTAGLVGFVADQSRARAQLLHFALLRRPGVRAATLIAFLYGAGLYGSTYLIPVYLLDLGQRSAWEAGAVLLPGGIVLALTLYVGGLLTDRRPAYRVLQWGLLAFVVSTAAFLVRIAPVELGWVVGCTIVGRIGLGLIIPSLNAGATRVAPEAFASTVTVLVNYFRQLGGTVGVGVVGVLLEFSSTPDHPALGFERAFLAMTLAFVPALLAAAWMRPTTTEP